LPSVVAGSRMRMHSRHEERAMVEAIVLIQAEVGESAAAGESISRLKGVTSVDVVTGPYDIIARVEAESLDELAGLVISKIQSVRGVSRTLTCPVIRF
jgi:DNA-binding Lrp family transcriptional regulator